MLKIYVITTILLFSAHAFAQGGASVELEVDPNSGVINCYSISSKEEVTKIKMRMDFCLANREVFNRLELFLDEDGKCLAFMRNEPQYFVAEIAESYCSDVDKVRSRVGLQDNVIMNANEHRRRVCEGLGLCMGIIDEQFEAFVDHMVGIIDNVNLNAHYLKLSGSVNDDSFQSNLEAFNTALSTIEALHNSCKNNRFYSTQLIENARNELRADLAEHSEVLEKDVFVYHWYEGVGSTLTTPSDGNHNLLALTHARFLQSRYFSSDRENGTGFQGRGLYASPSPSATQSYGNILLRIRLPAGSRYLDLEESFRVDNRYQGNPSAFLLRMETIEALKNIGCEIDIRNTHFASVAEDLNHIYVNKVLFSSQPNCIEVFNDVIKEEEYIFQTYQYRPVVNNICENSTSAAFVLIDNEMNRENVTAFNDPFYENEKSQLIEDLENISDDNNMLNTIPDSDTREQERNRLRDEYQDQFWDCQ